VIGIKWLMNSPYDESFKRTRVWFLVGIILGQTLLISQSNFGLPEPAFRNNLWHVHKLFFVNELPLGRIVQENPSSILGGNNSLSDFTYRAAELLITKASFRNNSWRVHKLFFVYFHKLFGIAYMKITLH
jgi:hypothetical protein